MAIWDFKHSTKEIIHMNEMPVEFLVLTAVVRKNSVSWDMSFNVCCLLHAGFLLSLLFDPEDGVGMFL